MRPTSGNQISGAKGVDGKDFGEQIFRGLVNGHAWRNAGAIHKIVNASKAFNGLINERLGLVGIGNIRTRNHDIAGTRGANFVRGVGKFIFSAPN